VVYPGVVSSSVPTRRFATPLLLAVVPLATGCPLATRTARFLGPEAVRIEEQPTGQLAEVYVTTGYGDEPEAAYAPETRQADGRSWTVPLRVTSMGSLRLVPRVDGATLEVHRRHTGLMPTGYEPIVAVTGEVPGTIPLEVRPLPHRLDDEVRVELRDLHNVYNGFAFEDGDMLLLTVRAPDEPVERYLFQTRRLGLRTKLGAGVLVRVPFPEVTAAPLAPVFAATVAVGYRPRTRAPVAAWAGDKLAVVGSLGVGTTEVPGGAGPVDDQLGSVYDAALGGGGLELYDVLSVQALVNLSSLAREASEARVTLAVGFDAVQFGRFTRDGVQRLFGRNHLSDPDAAGP